jgi:hypothetical protein
LESSDVHHNPLGNWTSAVNFFECKDGNRASENRIWANTDEDPRESEGHAIIMDTCGDEGGVEIVNNIIWGNEGYCVNIFNSDGAVIRNNTCWKNAVGRPNGLEISLRGENIQQFNNLVVSAGGARGLRISAPSVDYSTIESDYNLFWSPDREEVITWPPGTWGSVEQYKAANAYGWDQHSIQANPTLWVSEDRFLELMGNSPAIDIGNNSEAPPQDHYGFLRPLDGDGDGTAITDLGAFEYGGMFADGFESGAADEWATVVP